MVKKLHRTYDPSGSLTPKMKQVKMSWEAGNPIGTTASFNTTGRICTLYTGDMTNTNSNYNTLSFLWIPGCTIYRHPTDYTYYPTYTSLSYAQKIYYGNYYVEVTLTVSSDYKSLTATVTDFTSSQIAGFNFVIMYLE